MKKKKNIINMMTINTISITLTDNDIKSLPTAPFTIIAAPGTSKMIIPIMLVLNLKSTAYYQNIDSYCNILGIHLANSTTPISQNILTPMYESFGNGVTNFLGNDSDYTAIFSLPFGLAQGILMAQTINNFELENKPFALQCDNGQSGNFTGGISANTITANFHYALIDL